MAHRNPSRWHCLVAGLLILATTALASPDEAPAFGVVAFYLGRDDPAHVSFVREANRWFAETGREHGFSYVATTDWTKLNAAFLRDYRVVVFLDSRPDDPVVRSAFRDYMEHGGAWLGFHFAGFALTPSKYPQDWEWYHGEFLGAGSYRSNTWRPTSALLRVEAGNHPITAGLPATFQSSPNEWYRWERDLRLNPDIQILLSIDPRSFPLGTGPKPEEIWHEGYYPVAWTNRKYRMVYVNMGHNDLDYEHHTNAELSHTFSGGVQDEFILRSILWLGRAGGRTSATAGAK